MKLAGLDRVARAPHLGVIDAIQARKGPARKLLRLLAGREQRTARDQAGEHTDRRCQPRSSFPGTAATPGRQHMRWLRLPGAIYRSRLRQTARQPALAPFSP